jgi:hypothetical protein
MEMVKLLLIIDLISRSICLASEHMGTLAEFECVYVSTCYVASAMGMVIVFVLSTSVISDGCCAVSYDEKAMAR